MAVCKPHFPSPIFHRLFLVPSPPDPSLSISLPSSFPILFRDRKRKGGGEGDRGTNAASFLSFSVVQRAIACVQIQPHVSFLGENPPPLSVTSSILTPHSHPLGEIAAACPSSSGEMN